MWFLIKTKKDKILGILGILSLIVIIISTHSGGPILTLLSACFAIILYSKRKHMKVIVWGGITCIFLLSVYMKAPIWYLMSKVSSLVGGTGWHRAYLIDQAIGHINEWWLFGTNQTSHWMPYALSAESNMSDITNQFLVEGVRGGLVTMLIFIYLIYMLFKALNINIKHEGENKRNTLFLWVLGSSLFAHVISFFGVSYFDQITVVLFFLIGTISATTNIIFFTIQRYN